jgi:DNA-binding transcriptional LysR family regulator
MNTRFLDTFVTLAQQRSFRATARLLHTSAATISTRIKALEEELGTGLVDRTVADFRLTPSGQSLLPLARNVVDATRALEEAAGLELALGGPIRFGVVDTIVHSWLSTYVTQLRERLPGLVVELTVDSSPALNKKILNGELDIAVCAEVVDSDKITSSRIASYPVRWIVSRELLGHADVDPVRLALARPVLTFGKGTSSHLAVERIVRALAGEAGIPDEAVRMTCAPSVAAIMQLVRDGYGVGAVPHLLVHDELEKGRLAELALEPRPPSIDVSLCMSVNASPAVVAAADAARDVCAAYCGARPETLIRAV